MSKKRIKQSCRLHQAFTEVNKHTGQLEVVEWRVTPASPIQKKQIREEFHEVGRNAFYMHLASQNPSILLDIGFTSEQIGMIAETGLSDIGDNFPERYRKFNVDHILGVFWDGSHNNPENLCLVPKKINELKAEMEKSTAIKLNGRDIKISTISPTQLPNGQYRNHVITPTAKLNRIERRTLAA